MRRIILAFFIMSLLPGPIMVYSQEPSPTKGIKVETPQSQAKNENQKTQEDKRGTDASPLVTKITDTPESKNSAAQTAKYQNVEASNSRILIKITAIIAFAAILQWIVMIWQARQLKRSVDVLAASERAVLHIVVCESNIRELAVKHFVKYKIRNYGKTPALVKEISHCIKWAKTLPSIQIYTPIDLVLKERMVSAKDSTEDITCEVKDSENFMQGVEAFNEGECSAWFYGRVIYDDIFGNGHEHRFVWWHNVSTKGFCPYYKGSKYNKNT